MRVKRRNNSLQPQRIAGPIQLFVLMGREITAVEEVPAGNVFGILGLEGSVMKMGTLSDTPTCPSLSSLRLAVRLLDLSDRVERSDRADRGGDGARERHAAVIVAAGDSERERQQHPRVRNGRNGGTSRRRKRGSTSSVRWASCSWK